MGLGKSFYVKLVAAIVGIGVAALLGFLVFDRLVYRYGLIAGTAVILGVLLVIAYFYDRSHTRDYDDEEPAA